MKSLIGIILFLAACTPLSTIPFDPTKSKTSEEIAQAQIKALMPVGMKAPYSGMDCDKYVEYQIAECEATFRCSTWRYRQLKRDLQRLKKSYNSQCLYSKYHIDQVFRVMGRRGL